MPSLQDSACKWASCFPSQPLLYYLNYNFYCWPAKCAIRPNSVRFCFGLKFDPIRWLQILSCVYGVELSYSINNCAIVSSFAHWIGNKIANLARYTSSSRLCKIGTCVSCEKAHSLVCHSIAIAIVRQRLFSCGCVSLALFSCSLIAHLHSLTKTRKTACSFKINSIHNNTKTLARPM